MDLYSANKIDFIKEPMFFGKGKNTQRFDVLKYKYFDKNNDNQLARFWRPEEISLSKDHKDFSQSDDHIKFIFTKSIQRVIFLDSLQGRSPFSTFGQITTLPELENVILTWNFFEGSIHSRSYSYLLRTLYNNPSKIFDETFEDKLLMKQSKKIAEHYNKLYNLIIEYQYNESKGINNSDEFMLKLKKQLILALINVNILEGVRFYPAFVCIWAMTEGLNILSGSSKILKLICRDENQHLALVQKIINILKKEKSEGFVSFFDELEEQIIIMFKEALEQEYEWSDYIFSKGSFIGLNSEILKKYMEYNTSNRLRSIGYKGFVPASTKNPIPWITSWSTESSTEGTPQEAELTDYVLGSIDKTVPVTYRNYEL